MIKFDDKFISEMSMGRYKTWNEVNSLAIEKGIYFQDNFSIGMSNPSDSDLNDFLSDSFPLILDGKLLEGKALNLKNIYDYYQNVWISQEDNEIYEIVVNLFKYFLEISGSTAEELEKTNDIELLIEKTVKLAKNLAENTVYDQNKYNELMELAKIYKPDKK